MFWDLQVRSWVRGGRDYRALYGEVVLSVVGLGLIRRGLGIIAGDWVLICGFRSVCAWCGRRSGEVGGGEERIVERLVGFCCVSCVSAVLLDRVLLVALSKLSSGYQGGVAMGRFVVYLW